ncbi:MAG: hypothetical protein WCD18_11685 [Thermosynechococcaceae cyanobacterium]
MHTRRLRTISHSGMAARMDKLRAIKGLVLLDENECESFFKPSERLGDHVSPDGKEIFGFLTCYAVIPPFSAEISALIYTGDRDCGWQMFIPDCEDQPFPKTIFGNLELAYLYSIPFWKSPLHITVLGRLLSSVSYPFRRWNSLVDDAQRFFYEMVR